MDMSLFGLTIDARSVCIFERPVSKHEALDRLVDAIAVTGTVDDAEAFRRAVRERESVMSTGIGSGVAIPHVRIDAINSASVGVGISRDGIDFNTLDNKPVHIIVLFAMPSGSQKEYLGLLAQVMTTMKAPGFREKLGACATPDEVVSLLNTPAV
ncbi:MAG: PTS fructose/mannitol transporter subunit IIA [Candidatus Hydrogenedentota bacterium]